MAAPLSIPLFWGQNFLQGIPEQYRLIMSWLFVFGETNITVPGILELPSTLLYAWSSAGTGAAVYDGAIVLGCAVKGETDHYEHVCRESMHGVQRVALDFKIAVGNGILTCPTWELALNRADPHEGDAGGRAARACLRLIELKHRFGL